MNDWAGRIEQAKKALHEAEYVLLGGGAGLSAAAGLTYSGRRFTDHFAPFIEQYGFTDLYSSSFYNFKTQEERWAYWAKHISLNRYETEATKLYQDLFEIVKEKEYFVISTNVESQFVKAGFPPHQVFEIQGDYCYFQCENACHNKLYYNEEAVREMVAETFNCKIPSVLVPKCPVCGGEMDVNLRKNQYFVQDEYWDQANTRYQDFVNTANSRKTVYMELGVGFNTPGIIRYPFELWTYHNPEATLIRMNLNDPEGFKENKAKTIPFTEPMDKVVQSLLN
ncbi:Sir2 silent information regulator family NAD-dependent deacetylase [Paenibacillus macerans]|uniref:Sir2 silent information regulator family NAD-dependent deacetylase n=1 Tax=Paenibacillus macerans TaxID=44252 RepID=UPI003D318C5C